MAAPSQTSSMDSTEQAEAKKNKQTNKKKPRLQSPEVWEHFKQRPNNMVSYKFSKLEMAYHSSTTAMLEHLGKHPGATSQDSTVSLVYFLSRPKRNIN